MATEARTLALPADAWTRWENLAGRLGLSLDETLQRVGERMDLMNEAARQLAEPLPDEKVPLRLTPAVPICEYIAHLWVAERCVRTLLPVADDRYNTVVRRLGYKWVGEPYRERRWELFVNKMAEPVADRAVELGVRLLLAGFIVEVNSAELQRRIAASDYAPACPRWVSRRTAGPYTGYFCLSWEKNASCASKARLIRRAHVYPDAALVPAIAYDEVVDFAQAHGFRLTDGALDLVERAARERAAMLAVSPVIRPVEYGAAPAIEAAPEGILNELADEPL